VNGALLSVHQVAARCGFSEKAIYRAIERGELGAVKLCSRLRVRPDEVDAWIERSAIETNRVPAGSTQPRQLGHAAPNGLRGMLTAEARIAR
jgi:excisionase family DNA binding protein